MEKLQSLIECEKIRDILCQYLKEVLHISVKGFVQQHKELTTNMFFRKRMTKEQRSRVMDIGPFKMLCDVLDIKIFQQDALGLENEIILDTSNPDHPLAFFQSLRKKKEDEENSTKETNQIPSFEVKTLGALANLTNQLAKARSLVIRFDRPDPVPVLPVQPVSFANTDRFVQGYVNSREQYDLLLNHGVYYVRTGKVRGCVDKNFFAQLPQYLIVFPKQWMKRKQADGTRQFVHPYSIRIFKVRQGQNVPNGPAPNSVFDQWSYTHYDDTHSHGFLYLESEVSDRPIDQAKAAKALMQRFKTNSYAPVCYPYSALVSYDVFRNE